MTSADEKMSTVVVKVEYVDNTEHTNYPNSILQHSSEDVIVKSEATSDKCPLVSSSELAVFCDCSTFHPTNRLLKCGISCKEESGVFIKTELIECGEKGASETFNEVNPSLYGLTLDNKDVLRDELESKTGVFNISEVIVMDSQVNSVTKNEESCTMISNATHCIDRNTSNDVTGKMSAPNLSLQNFKFGVFYLKNFVKRKPVDGGGEVVTFQCNKCEFESWSDVFFKQHYKNNHFSEFHPCFTCCKLFLNEKSLQSHNSLRHRASKTYSCSRCDFTADSYMLLRRHQRSKHFKNVHKCDQCEYHCSCKSQLQRHKLGVHDEIKNRVNEVYKCDVCCMRFIDLSPFVRHKRIHTGERPYSCDLCDYASSCCFYIKQHKLRKHSQFKEQTSSSGEPAREQTLINRNGNQCVEHQCAMCPFKTTSWKILIGHRKRSHGNEHVNDIKEKRFQCGQCLKHFAYEGSLRRHTFGTKGRCLGIKDGISSIKKKDKIDTSQTRSSRSKTKRGPSDSKVMAKDSVLECRACKEQFPALKVLKRHLKYCVFNS